MAVFRQKRKGWLIILKHGTGVDRLKLEQNFFAAFAPISVLNTQKSIVDWSCKRPLIDTGVKCLRVNWSIEKI